MEQSRAEYMSQWSKAGHFSVALSKGGQVTTWIWNLHSDAHDFRTDSVLRKVFSSNLAHLSLVFFWLGGMHFHGAYFANTSAWNKDPKHCFPSAHTVSSLVGQDILNSDVGGYFQGIYITSGFFQLWRSEGIVADIHLKYACTASLIGTIVCMGGSYFHMHIAPPLHTNFWLLGLGPTHQEYHALSLFFGLGSMSWSGHLIHISLPINRLLDSGVDPAVIPWPQDLLFRDCQEVIHIGPLVSQEPFYSPVSRLGTSLSPSTASLCIGTLGAHHFYLALVLIASGLIRYAIGPRFGNRIVGPDNSSHAQLSISLLFVGSSSIVFAHHVYAIPVYPYLALDYPTVLSLFCHHINIGVALTVGAGAHASIHFIRDSLKCQEENYLPVGEVLNHRCLIVGHLIYLSIALGLHSFGLYIHNDTLQSLSRAEDMFADNSIQLKPVFAILVPSLCSIVTFDVEILDGKVATLAQELGTADFMVHHIHAFTIHVTSLILLKGVLYARSSRLVSDKLELGWRYPCDGPGRGGTCQISPNDHLYLAVFWAYNSLSVVLFHYFWKMQSDVWAIGSSDLSVLEHISGGDFSVNSGTINGWLRNFLWSEAAQVIQSYGTSISAYGLIFLCAHFVWAFALMFLYSGRGYWQELIESILWAHHKLKIVNVIQPRALSISHGRAVALVHYILGGIGCTFAFVVSRMIALS